MEQILLAVVISVVILEVVRQNSHNGGTDDLRQINNDNFKMKKLFLSLNSPARRA